MTGQYFKLHNGKICKVIEVESNLVGGKGFDAFVKIIEPDHMGLAGWDCETWVAVCRGEFVDAPATHNQDAAHKPSGNNQTNQTKKGKTMNDVFKAHLQHGTGTNGESVKVKNEYGDRWLAWFEGRWRRVHIQVNRTYIVFRGEKITIQIEGV